MYNCNIEGISSMNQIFEDVNDKWDCINSGAEWKNKYLNFDSVPSAMATLFVISNSVQWGEIMYQASGLRGRDLVPNIEEIEAPLVSLYFIFIVIVGNFFLLNLFIGVIISKYNREREL